MMNNRVAHFLCICGITAALSGCEIVSEPRPAPKLQPANNVVINELFVLPQSDPNYFFWIEFYNPTNNRVDISRWTLGFKTLGFVVAYNSSGFPIYFSQDTVAQYHDVPLRMFRNNSIGPNGFQTVVSDKQRMQNYTKWVGDLEPVEQGATYALPPDTVTADSIVQAFYTFLLSGSDELVLKDNNGNVVDVVRYGNYVHQGGADPYPNNHSLGSIVPFQSYSRFGGAYTSGSGGNAALGSSAADFFVTGQGQYSTTVPTPQWLNQGYKY